VPFHSLVFFFFFFFLKKNRGILRHVKVAEKRTTIRLEPSFWLTIDQLAATDGIHWRELVRKMLAAKPEGQAATSWLRVCCLNWSREV
jgi:predicted DNA-binding ribbon-helix-helix protein